MTDGMALVTSNRDLIAVCPYCAREHQTDVVTASGECPNVLCCAERHCYEKGGPLDVDYGRDPDCTCVADPVGPQDIDPPEIRYGKGRNEWCPVHGRDPDYERDRRIDDALTGDA